MSLSSHKENYIKSLPVHSAKGMDHFILLTLGTGLGSGVVINGKIVSGSNGLAAEYGHSVLVKNGRSCNCGQRGCFETYVSATGLKRTAISLLANTNQHCILRDLSPNQLDAQKIAEASENGDEIAKMAIKKTAQRFRNGSASWTSTWLLLL